MQKYEIMNTKISVYSLSKLQAFILVGFTGTVLLTIELFRKDVSNSFLFVSQMFPIGKCHLSFVRRQGF